MSNKSDNITIRTALACLGLVLITLVVFWQTRNFPFLEFDDDVYVTKNIRVLQGLTTDNIRWAFTTLDAEFWHPLTWLSLMLDVELFGEDAGWFHLDNLAFHVGSVLLLFLTLSRATSAIGKSAFVAALFAIHPLHVESVVWVSERKDVLSIFFGMLSLWSYVRYCEQKQSSWYVLSILAFLFSLMSKSTLVTLPCVLFLLDFWPLRRIGFQRTIARSYQLKEVQISEPSMLTESVNDQNSCTYPKEPQGKLLIEKTPFLILTILFCILTLSAQSSGGGLQSTISYPFLLRLNNTVLVYGIYIRKMFWPNDLAIYYEHPGSSLETASVFLAAILLIVITCFVIAYRRRSYLLVGWFWYFGTLVPMIGIIQIWDLQMADRFTYFPLIGLFIAVVWLIDDIVPSTIISQRNLSVVATFVLLSITVLGAVQTSRWQTNRALFQHSIAVSESHRWGHDALGTIFHQQKQLPAAIRQYRKSIEISPRFPIVHSHLGMALCESGDYGEGISHFQEAIRLNTNASEVRHNYGVALLQNDHPEEAIIQFKKAIELNPNDYLGHFNLAIALHLTEQDDVAIHHLKQAVLLNPRFEQARKQLQKLEQRP